MLVGYITAFFLFLYLGADEGLKVTSIRDGCSDIKLPQFVGKCRDSPLASVGNLSSDGARKLFGFCAISSFDVRKGI